MVYTEFFHGTQTILTSINAPWYYHDNENHEIYIEANSDEYIEYAPGYAIDFQSCLLDYPSVPCNVMTFIV